MAILTIAVLTHNRSAYLAEALGAILRQTYADYELVVLDNASTDDTGEVVRSFDDPRIRYLRHERNVGGPGNYNAALALCSTPYLLITHDDDRMKPTMVERELAEATRNPEVNLVCCEVDLIGSQGQLRQANHYSHLVGLSGDLVVSRYGFLREYFSGRNFICCPTILLRMAPVKENHLAFRPPIGPAIDTMFWMELNCLPGEIHMLSESLYEYRIHDGQDSVHRADQIVLGLKVPVLQLVASMGEKRLYRRARLYFRRRIRPNLFRILQGVGRDKKAFATLAERLLAPGDHGLKLVLKVHNTAPWFAGFWVSLVSRTRRGLKSLLQVLGLLRKGPRT